MFPQLLLFQMETSRCYLPMQVAYYPCVHLSGRTYLLQQKGFHGLRKN
jgi:hypothetical protein